MKTAKNRVLVMLSVLMIVIAGVGCSTVAHVEKDETVNFSKFKTYKWSTEGTLKERNSNDIVDSKLKAAMDQELQKNGWRESKSNADVMIDYDIAVEKAVKERSDPVYSRPFTRYFYNPYTGRVSGLYFPSRMMGYRNSDYPYTEGTVTIHMMDNKTNKLIWEGWTSDELNGKNPSGKEIEASVKSIMKKFNPEKSEG